MSEMKIVSSFNFLSSPNPGGMGEIERVKLKKIFGSC